MAKKFTEAKKKGSSLVYKHFQLLEIIEQINSCIENYNFNVYSDTININFVLCVYKELVQVSDSIFANSKPKEHLIFYELNNDNNIYNKNLALLHHAYTLTNASDHARTAFLLTENYKSIELWQKDSIKGDINILHKTDIPKIQKKLATNQALISYHYGTLSEKTDSSYAFVCTKDTISFQAITVDTTMINRYVKELNRYVVSENYLQYAYQLYQNLFAPLPIDTANIDELIIIASGRLSLIPFEALLTKNDNESDFARMSYLLRKYAISYDLSLPFWFKVKSFGQKF
ncbi:MAG: CHAT domain-containing protein [Chitinophagales bacterium]